jgi:hypothetical protein
VLSAVIVPGAAIASPPVLHEYLKLSPGALSAPGEFGFEHFGAAIDLECGRVLVGAWADNTIAEWAGAGYLFDAHNGELLHKLTTSFSTAYDGIGQSVALDDNIALVGTPESSNLRGMVHAFNATTGVRFGQIFPAGAGLFEHYGQSLALDGTTAVVGAPFDDDNGRFAGAAYLMNASTNRLIAKVKPSDGVAEDFFGTSVDIQANLAIVGEPGNGFEAGAAYLFNAATGAQLAKLEPSDGAIGDDFGSSVAIDGNYAVIGARSHSEYGAAYLFDISNPAAPVELTKWLPDEFVRGFNSGSSFGISVDISGNVVIVGTRPLPGWWFGPAYLFHVKIGNQIARLLPAELSGAGDFGQNVAIEGRIAVVSAELDNPNGLTPGAVYLFHVPEPQSLPLLTVGAATLLFAFRDSRRAGEDRHNIAA